MNTDLHSTTRFSDRVENYVKFRPHYPQEVLDFFIAELGLTKDSVVADVGSGTGMSSEMFLQNGNLVYAIEPNREMREAAEKLFKNFSNFLSVAATAEETKLKSHSIDFILAGQSFHWFDLRRTRIEFKKILSLDGHVVLMWNERKTDSSDFLRDYEVLLNTYGLDYKEVKHKNVDERVLNEFFGRGNYRHKIFMNSQLFNFEGLRGRLLSSSYVPAEGHPSYKPMIDELETLFDRHEKNGMVKFEYDTKLYHGRLK